MVPKTAKAIKKAVTNGANVNSMDFYGKMKIHKAATRGKTEQVKALIELGAKPDAATLKGELPICLASANGHLDITQKAEHLGPPATPKIEPLGVAFCFYSGREANGRKFTPPSRTIPSPV